MEIDTAPLRENIISMWMHRKRVKPENLWIGVTGVFTSDRMPFIRTVSDIPVKDCNRPMRGQPSKPFSVGQIAIDQDMTLNFYSNPDNSDPNGIFYIDEPGMIGAVIMVDSTDPETFHQVRNLLKTIHVYRQETFPYVIVLNKQNFPGAWSIHDVRHALSASDDEVFIPCNAIDRASVKHVLLTLLGQLLDCADAAEA
ncbi:MAG: hypothetical protein ABI700_09240 [Chloroflexota bacterium]